MSKRRPFFIKMACWLVVCNFVLASVEMHRLIGRVAQPDSIIWCGNIVTAPLSDLLNVGVPLNAIVVVTLGAFWRRGLASGWSVIPGALLLIGCTISILFDGNRFIREVLPGYNLPDFVWWLSPVGGLFGI